MQQPEETELMHNYTRAHTHTYKYIYTSPYSLTKLKINTQI